ncbi:MAG: shikimate kinase [SAR324 cluster bacterium]|nr:shikimate kinase [SAR324 cluster bacterium]
MNILLTGFMGAGKTTIGRKLAKLLDYSFIDTDTEIEEDQGCSVTEIFKYGGEECFREMETRQLEKLKSVDNSVIATGGGIILRRQNRGMLQEIGKRVYLKVPQAELLQRLRNGRNRPLLKEKDPETVLNEMFAERDLLYEQAECIIETGQQSPQQIASEIIRKLCNEDSDHNF